MARMPERLLRLTPLAFALGIAFQGPAFAVLPTGGQFAHGSGTIATSGTTMTVTNAPNSVINWNTFSIGAANAVQFNQQSASSVVLNRVVGAQMSEILGRLGSNGQVFLVNPSGILIGAGAVIDTSSFVASTLPMLDADFLAGRLRFSGDASSGSIVNHGLIRTGLGGRVLLAAPYIENAPAFDGQGALIPNTGLISAPGGRILLAAGQKLTVGSMDLEGVQFEVQAPTDSAVNVGRLLADGGAVHVLAGTLRHSGDIRANSMVRDEAGEIVLRAQGAVELAAASRTRADGRIGGGITVESVSGRTRVEGQVSAIGSTGIGGRIDVLGETVSLGASALVNASGATGGGSIRIGGDYQGANPDLHNAQKAFVGAGARLRADATYEGDGGRIIVWADQDTRFLGTLSARGGPLGGNGGFAEVSGKGELLFLGGADLGASRGVAGNLLLDPLDLFIDDRGGLNPSIIDENTDFPDNAATVSPTTLAAITGSVTLFASRDLRFNSAVTLTGAGQGLTARAGRDLQVGANISTNGGAVSLSAGRDLSVFDTTAIGTAGGNVTLTAGEALSGDFLDINAGSGSVSMTASDGSLRSGTVSGSSGITLSSTGGSVIAGSLTATGGIALSSTGGAISAFTMTATGPVSLTSTSSVNVSSILSGGGAVNVSSSAGSINLGSVNTVAGAGPASGAVALNASSFVRVDDIAAGASNVTLSGTDVRTVEGTITTTGSVSLTATDGSVNVFVNDAASVTATSNAGPGEFASVRLDSSSLTTPLNATAVTATVSGCSGSFSCGTAEIELVGNQGVNVGTVVASAPATTGFPAPFNSINESVVIRGGNGPILAMGPSSQVTAADVELATNQGSGGGIGALATPMQVNVERNFTFRPNGEFGVLLNGSGPNQLFVQPGVAPTGLGYTGSLTKPGQITLSATATDTVVTVSDFTITGGFNDVVFNGSPSIALDVPNGGLVATNVSVPQGDQVGRRPPFSSFDVIQDLPVSLSSRDTLVVGNYARATASSGFGKSVSFSSAQGAVTLATISADRDSVGVFANTDVVLEVTGGITTAGDVTINAANGNVTIGGNGINTTSGGGSVSITAIGGGVGQGEIRAATDASAREVDAGGSVFLEAQVVDTAAFANPFDIAAPSVSIVSIGPAIGHAGSPVTAVTTQLTINAAGEFNVSTPGIDLQNLTVTASPAGVGLGGLARVTTGTVPTAYDFASDGTDFSLSGWTSTGTQFAGGTLSFTSTTGDITLDNIDFSSTNGSLTVIAGQRVTGDITQAAESTLNLGTGFLNLHADGIVSLGDVTAGGMFVTNANGRIFGVDDGGCEIIGFFEQCAPASVSIGNLVDPTAARTFDVSARHGITAGNLLVGDLNMVTHEGALTIVSIGSSTTPAGTVSLSANPSNAGVAGSVTTGAVEATNLFATSFNGDIQTGSINVVKTDASQVHLNAFNGNVNVVGTVSANDVRMQATGGAAGNIDVGNINPVAATSLPGLIELLADTDITAGTLDADSIVVGSRCCGILPSIATGSIGSRLSGNSVVFSGSSISVGGAINLDAAGTGQRFDVFGSGTVTIAGDITAGLGGTVDSPQRLSAGNLLLVNSGNGVISFADGSVIRLQANNTDTALPLQFARITAGPSGDIGIVAPAGLLQTAGGATDGITGGVVNLSSTASGSSMSRLVLTAPGPLNVRGATDLTIDTGGSVNIDRNEATVPALVNLDITRRSSAAGFGLAGFAPGQSASVIPSTSVFVSAASGTPMRFRYRDLDASPGAVSLSSIATSGGQIIVESTTDVVSVDGAIDGGSGDVSLSGTSVLASAGGSVASSGLVRVVASNGDIGASGAALPITSPTVQLQSKTSVAASSFGHTFADLTGTTHLVLDADHGFDVVSDTALDVLSVSTRGDQTGNVVLSGIGQSFGFLRNGGTLDVSGVSSATPLSSLSIGVANGNLRIVGTGTNAFDANDVFLSTTGLLELDGVTAPLVMNNAVQSFSGGTGGSDISIDGRVTIAATGSQSLSAGRDILVRAGTAAGDAITLSSAGSQLLSANRDILLRGGTDLNTQVNVSVSGPASQTLVATRNIDLEGGTGDSAGVSVSQTGGGQQTISANVGNLSLRAGTANSAAVSVTSSGANTQRLFAGGTLAMIGGSDVASTGAAVTVTKTGGGVQQIDAGGTISLAGGLGTGASVTVSQVGGANQDIGDNFCCSDPTDNLTLQGGDGADSFAKIETDGRQFLRPAVLLSLLGGAGNGSFARISTSNSTSASTTVSNGPQIVGYSNTFDCCSGDQIDSIVLAGGSGVGTFAEIASAGSQRVAFGSGLTATGGGGSGAYARITALAQDVRSGNVSLLAGTGNGANASIEATGSEANRTLGASALQVIDPGTLTLAALGLAGATPTTATAHVSSGGTQRITASTTTIAGGVGPDSIAAIKAAGNQSLFFGLLTLQGGTGANTRATIESASGGQSISASSTQVIGGTGVAGAGQDAGAFIINTAAAQTLNLSNLTIRSGADFAPAGVVNLGTGTTQAVSAGAITIDTTTGANGFSTSPLGGANTAAIVSLGSGNQSISASSINIDNQFGNGTIGISSSTGQSVSGGNVTVSNATASGVARIDATTTQSFAVGNVTVSSSGTAGEARITGATQTFSDSGRMTVEVTGGGGAARIAASGGTQNLRSNQGFRVRASGGSGSATLTNAGGSQVLTGAFVDVATLAGATGNAELTASGDQSIHTTNGTVNPDGGASLRVVSLGSGTARIESSGSQLLEIDYPEMMQVFVESPPRDGRIVIGDATAAGKSLIAAAVDQDVFAHSIELHGGQALDATAKMTAADTQNISTLLGGITAAGGSGANASALIDPIVQNILVNGRLAVSGGAGSNAVGGLTGSGAQVVLVTQGMVDSIAVSGGAGSNAFGQITTSGGLQRIGTSGGFALNGGAGLNADAIVGANGGAALTLLACGTGTCTFTSIPAASNPFLNALTDVGVYFNPTVVALDLIGATDLPVLGRATSPPFDPENLVLWDFDWDPDGERFGRYRFGRALPVCR